MKLKMLSVASAGVYFAIGGGLLGCNSKQPPPPFVPTVVDSPINIGGGSIYVDYSKGTLQSFGQKTSTALVNYNINQISIDGVDGVPPTLTLSPGWVITLANKGMDGTRKQAAVTICPDQPCAGTAGNGHTVYLTAARSDTRWGNVDGRLRFHDNACDGDSGDLEHPSCDFLLDVTIESPKGTPLYSQKACRGSYGAGTCLIQIGTLKARGQ
jgi:hypothetical protein